MSPSNPRARLHALVRFEPQVTEGDYLELQARQTYLAIMVSSPTGKWVSYSDVCALLPDLALQGEAGSQRIAAERRRQVSAEGWTPTHDDEHRGAEMVAAAICYASYAACGASVGDLKGWPWEPSWWKPSTDPIRNLEKAGALIAAEIDRLLRVQDQAQPSCDAGSQQGRDDVRVGFLLSTLRDRQVWYATGCQHLESTADYFASGDLAQDAASDLKQALELAEHAEARVATLQQEREFQRQRADKWVAVVDQQLVELEQVREQLATLQAQIAQQEPK